MAFLNIMLGESVNHVSITNNQLHVKSKDSGEHRFALRDINSLIIENTKITLTVFALEKLISERVAVYLCDAKHHPCGVVLPFNNHYSQFRIFKLQYNAPRPLQKQIWQQIVKQKIINQSMVLRLLEKQGEPELLTMAKEVNSGDTLNKESTSAGFYWRKYFDNKFHRSTDCFANDALNYGYSILRGQIARSVVAHGLQPFLGIHHENELNAFNLVDDLIEPLRPFVDLLVAKNFDFSLNKLLPEHKQKLLDILNLGIEINGKIYSLPNAIEIIVETFVASLRDNTVKINLPTLRELKSFKYE